MSDEPSAPGTPGPPPRRSPWDAPAGAVPTPPPFPNPAPPAAPAEPAGSSAPDAGAQPWGSWTPPAAPSTGPYGAPGAGPEPIRGVRGQRYGAPRVGGRGVLAVFGLLGVLITVGIMVFLFVQVLDGVDGPGDQGVDVQVDAGGGPATVVPSDPTGPGDAGAPTDAARAARCRTDRDTVETAATAYQITHGEYPADVTTLVAAGLLAPPERPIEMELHVEGGELVVTGTGACAGA